MDPFSERFWLALGVAVLCSTVVGLERQVRGKPVGVRTAILICVSTFVFVKLGATFGGERADPTRVLGQVVTGVGFLGAGVILSRGGVVTGVTTAAVIWILAAIGATIAFGQFLAAGAYALLTVVVLVGVDLLESTFRRLRGGVYAADDEVAGTID
jgi:putative Mg2+ transporter-C (MgtC) family protein